jgi:hypothetical protein
MNKFLKKNYKKIIVICLIILLFSNKMYENFSTSDALNAVASTEKKVNDMFYTVDRNWTKSTKGHYSKKSIEADSHVVSRKGNVSAKVDVIAGRNMTATGNVNADGNVKGKKLCINDTCLTENHLKLLTDGFYFKQVGGKGDVHRKNQWNHTYNDNRVAPTGNTSASPWCGNNGEKCASKYRMYTSPD